MMLFFLLLSCFAASLSPLPSCPTGKTLEIVHLPKGKSLRPGHSFFSVRFVKITLTMILLATRKMWLLKMALWKNSHPFRKTLVQGWNYRHWTYFPCKCNSRGCICVLKARESESHNPRQELPLDVPRRLFTWNSKIAEAELIWQEINLHRHLQSQ